MQQNIYELDFSEIDILNPFSIMERTPSPQSNKSGSSFTESSPYLEDLNMSIVEKDLNSRKAHKGRKIDDFDYNARIQEELVK